MFKNLISILLLFGVTCNAQTVFGSISPTSSNQRIFSQTEREAGKNRIYSTTTLEENVSDSLQAFRRSSNFRNRSKRNGRPIGNTGRLLNRQKNRGKHYYNQDNRIYRNTDRTRSLRGSGRAFGGNNYRKRYKLNKQPSRGFEFITPSRKNSSD